MRIKWRNLELPTRVVADRDTLTRTYGRFTAEPFERGFGTTVGNSLRRVLLSSLEGTAVTTVKIEGVPHEFTSIDGVYEDITDLVLNVKGLLIEIDTDEEVTLSLEAKNKGPITAAELVCDHRTKVVNPDLHLFTLTKKRTLQMDLTARRGRGYVTAEENTSEDQPLGIIPIDSIFSPVTRVRYTTENTRVGKLTNYDKLIMEIWTDGTVAPEMAIVEAAKILRRHLNPFIGYFKVGKELQKVEVKREDRVMDKELEDLRKQLDQPIEVLDLSVRAANCIEAENIKTVRDLVVRKEEDMLQIRNLGKTSLKEIKKKLAERNLSLGMESN